MPGLLHNLDKYVDKMKKNVNHKIDKLGHNSKFDTSDFKKSHKNSYWDNNDKPKRKKSMGENLLTLFLTLIIVISIICAVIFVNSNVIFLVKVASPAFMKEMFPSDCNKPPYGTEEKCMCPPCDRWDPAEIKALERKLTIENKEASVGGGAPSCKPKGEFPYNHFEKADEGIREQYINWFLKSLAHTQMGMNSHIKWFISKLDRLDERLLLIAGSLILIILPIVFFYTLFILIKNQIGGFFSVNHFFSVDSWITKIIIFFTFFIVVGADQFVSLYNMVAVAAKLTLYPWWAENGEQRPAIKNIWARHLGLIKIVFGLAFVIAVLAAPFKKEYSALKLVILLWFLIPLIIHLIIYIKELLGGMWGQGATCKLER